VVLPGITASRDIERHGLRDDPADEELPVGGGAPFVSDHVPAINIPIPWRTPRPGAGCQTRLLSSSAALRPWVCLPGPVVVPRYQIPHDSPVTVRTARPPEAVTETLHHYFAEELLSNISAQAHSTLLQMTWLPVIRYELAKLLTGTDPDAVLAEAIATGFLLPDTDRTYELHPLLRSFLKAKRTSTDDEAALAVAPEVIRMLVAQEKWDEAFAQPIEDRSSMWKIEEEAKANIDAGNVIAYVPGKSLSELFGIDTLQTDAS